MILEVGHQGKRSGRDPVVYFLAAMESIGDQFGVSARLARRLIIFIHIYETTRPARTCLRSGDPTLTVATTAPTHTSHYFQ